MLSNLLRSPIDHFTPADQRNDIFRGLGARSIGRSEHGRDIPGVTLGSGPLHISLISGNHADEPVGAETLRILAQHLHANPSDPLLKRFTFHIIPHTNPDGEIANFRGWIDHWPDFHACRNFRGREKPGRDMEFGFPDMRPENRIIADYLKPHAPYAMHISLHGMTTCSGVWHLIHRLWVQRTTELRRRYAAAVHAVGLELFDWDRKGDKGFWHIAPGFATTPESGAMRDYFLARNDPDTAGKFSLSSMEYIRGLGGDPLCMVTEIPLFIDNTPVPIDTAVRLQLTAIQLGLDLISPT